MTKISVQKNTREQCGFALLVAMIVTATLLLVSTTIVSLSVREAHLSRASVDSQYAFYAADTGIECAIYWDVKNPNVSAFATSSPESTQIYCNIDGDNPMNVWSVGGDGYVPSSFRMTFLPDPYCADVTVTKGADGSTRIEATGYNTCVPNDPRRVARAVRVTY